MVRRNIGLPLLIILGALCGILSFGAVAHAANIVAPPDGSIMDLAAPLLNAFRSGQYALAVVSLVIVLCAMVKRYAGQSIPWLHSDAGGAALALITSTATAVVADLATPGAFFTWEIAKSALFIGVGAAGGYAVLKHLLIVPILRPLAARAVARAPWSLPIFRVVLWIFDSADYQDPTPTVAPITVVVNNAQPTDGTAAAPINIAVHAAPPAAPAGESTTLSTTTTTPEGQQITISRTTTGRIVPPADADKTPT